MFITTDQIFTSQPFELFRVDDDIRRVGTTGKLAATGTVAVLKNILRTGKLIIDGITQATTPDFFTHGSLQCLVTVQKIQSLILQISGAITKNIDFRSVFKSLAFSNSESLTANFPLFTVT
jgi:hypothetical protein